MPLLSMCFIQSKNLTTLCFSVRQAFLSLSHLGSPCPCLLHVKPSWFRHWWLEACVALHVESPEERKKLCYLSPVWYTPGAVIAFSTVCHTCISTVSQQLMKASMIFPSAMASSLSRLQLHAFQPVSALMGGAHVCHILEMLCSFMLVLALWISSSSSSVILWCFCLPIPK